MYNKIRSHLPQFGQYLLSGGGAAAIELTSYKLMLLAGIWYLGASVTSAALGLLSAFVFHKYFVFRKKENVMNHAARYAVLQIWNFFAQTAIVFISVEHFGVLPFYAKILGIGATVSWNFFLYKFLVYV